MNAQTILLLFVLIKISEYLGFLLLHILNMHHTSRIREIPQRLQNRFSPEIIRKSRKYTLSRHRLSIVVESYDFLILFIFIFAGGFGFLESLSIEIFRAETARALFFCLVIMLGKQVLELPFSIYGTFVVEQKYGFNKMTPALFLKDRLKGWTLYTLFGVLLIYFLIRIIRIAGDAWWIYGFLGVSAFQLFLLWIYPSLIAPLFNRFTPLEEGPLKSRILEIAEKIGFGISEIYIMDGSRRSSHSNAYFTGFGKNRRIVLFDTLTKSLSTPQLVGVLAHEMGHNKLHHIRTNILVSFALSFAGFYLWSHLIDYPPFYRAFGLSGEQLFPALVLFPLVMGPLSFFLSPLMNILSRRFEYDSDAFAAETTGRPEDLAQALEILNKENLSNLNPHPCFSFFYYSHPTLDERLEALESLKKTVPSDGDPD